MAAARRKRRARSAIDVTPKTAKSESETLQKARAQIRKFIEKTAGGKPAVSVGLVLALVNQETGNHRAANVLIDEFALDKRFGLKKFDFSADQE